jgi:CheY-like chemotaxis protein
MEIVVSLAMKNCRILLVDDDIEDYLIMKQSLTDLGVDDILEYAPSGQKALDTLEHRFTKHGTVPSIVVLDINMPTMSGPDVLKIMRDDDRFAKVPVVIYSTSINPSDEKQCQELGAEYCITKPGTLEEIIRVGETLLALCEKRDPMITPDVS